MIGGMAVEVDWGRVVEHGSGMVGGHGSRCKLGSCSGAWEWDGRRHWE